MTTLLTLLLLLIKCTIGVVALTVLMSFTVAWYERANSLPDLIDRRFTTRGLCVAIWLLIQETACLLLTILMRPFGWPQPKLPTAESNARPPIILLHGFFYDSYLWESNIDILAEKFKVFALDLWVAIGYTVSPTEPLGASLSIMLCDKIKHNHKRITDGTHTPIKED